ncbi:MAG TPA: hypothetical protein VL122_08075 [Nitrospirota bacterium]|nr:hypothetical protein [Nitrospirota bacterium]
MKLAGGVTLLIVIIAAASPVYAEGTWTAEIFGGSSYSFPTPLRIRQPGYEDIDITARYETKPFERDPYYAWRIGKWQDGSAWEFEHVHQKLYLTNKPAEVQQFQITYGYSLFTLNRAWKYGGFIYRFGAGVVVTSSFSVVRGEKYEQSGGLFDTGYFLSGATIQGAVGRRIYLTENLFLALEGKLTASYARVDIANGYAQVPNAAVHWLFGLGYDF